MLANFLFRVFSIVMIDLLLAGDNALVIAMAVRSLPKPERKKATICGAALAVILRVALTAVAARLLTLPFLQLAGGLLVAWIAFKVLIDASDPPDCAPAPGRFLQAIWYITAADLTMSLDNILAIAGASGGSLVLIGFGLCLSIPFVIFSSNLLANLMDRYPVLVYIGVAILGKVAGDMIASDPFVAKRLYPSATAHYILDAALIAGILVAGLRIARTRNRRQT
jgi:YjbE family integral membrane protein